MAQKVPFPFNNAKQYETYNRNPLGKEWNTLKMYSALSKPAVDIKEGLLIEPLSKKDKKRKPE